MRELIELENRGQHEPVAQMAEKWLYAGDDEISDVMCDVTIRTCLGRQTTTNLYTHARIDERT